MPTPKRTFNPNQDTLVTTLFLHRDEEGNMLDIDTHLYHSEEHGFYLQEKKVQFWVERCWETMSELDHRFATEGAPRRILKCACRPLTTWEVIRLIVDHHVPEEEGARDLALSALANASVKGCPQEATTSET